MYLVVSLNPSILNYIFLKHYFVYMDNDIHSILALNFKTSVCVEVF